MIHVWQPRYILYTALFSILLLFTQGRSAQASGLFYRAVNGVTVGGRVWRDGNGDGVQAAHEPGLAKVVVALFDVAGTLINMGTTDGLGRYEFEGLEPGRYYVIPDLESVPTGLSPTLPNVGDSMTYDSVTDSDLLPAQGRTAPTFAIPAGGRFLSLDLGFYPLATVGGRAWHDLNGDGIQDIGEPMLSDVEVHLLDDTGQLASTMTDSYGYYHFPALPPGSYQLLFVGPEYYRFSPPGQGDPAQLDSDAVPQLDDPRRGESRHFELAPGQNRTSLDVGLYGITGVQGFVWADSNGDGFKGQAESRLSDVDVKLFSYDEGVVAQAVTDGMGQYGFTDLLPGDYYLQFTAPSGLICTHRPEDGDDSLVRSQVDPASEQILLGNLGMDGADISRAAGFTEPSTIQDRVWLDENLNGLLDVDEAGLADILVELYDHTGYVVDSTRSDSQGFFQFRKLTPGSYQLQVHRSEGYTFTHFVTKDTDIDGAEEGTSGVNQIHLDQVASHVDPAGNSGMVVLRPGVQSGFASAGLAQQEPTQVLPNAIALLRLKAQRIATSAGESQVQLSWEVESGDAVQYFVYRSIYREDAPHMAEERALVARIIPESTGETGSVTHQWLDDSALPSLHYRYWLVSVSESEEGTEFGPVDVNAVSMADASVDRRVFLPLIYDD